MKKLSKYPRRSIKKSSSALETKSQITKLRAECITEIDRIGHSCSDNWEVRRYNHKHYLEHIAKKISFKMRTRNREIK